ncbi:MAG: M23 family metallopeptidase, partial [Candidatus Pacebacteria bacterium]|nr:M23 family metallopeptidase [Candidatus Paceibacterota bacterium]
AGLGYENTLQIIDAINDVYDVTKIKTDQEVTFVYFDKIFEGLSYDVDNENTLLVERGDVGFISRIEAIKYDIEVTSRSGTITTSFYNDGIETGLTPRIIMELADIFAFDVDFVNSIQEGDSFAVVYERLARDGELVGTGDILAARFTTSGETFYAYQVIDEDGNKEHYGADGGSSRRLLLKSPLNFKRISSNFGNRKHPISGDWKSHKGIDLAADTGTPVESVGAGTVVSAGWNGGYGKYVRIKHSSGYETAYAHLSKISVKKGERVSQGQLIGAVGTTGSSTGPHLHYELHANGKIVHPFNTDTPKEDPISDALRPQLDAMVAQYIGMIQE